MKKLARTAALGLLLLLACCTSASAQIPTTPNAQPEDSQTVKALLKEVRALRLVMAKGNIAGYRAQVLVERLRLQQERVDAIAKEFDDLQKRIKTIERDLPRRVEQIADFEKMVALNQPSAQRADVDMAVKEMKAGLERDRQELQDMRERQTQMSAKLQLETAKLEEINDRLDRTERELEGAPTLDDAPAEKGATKKP